MDYIPQQPKVEQPKSEYVLVDDMTHIPAPKRGPQSITIVRYDEEGKKQEVQVKVPYLPKNNCKKCYGRGYIGFDVKTRYPLPCVKCYPPRH